MHFINSGGSTVPNVNWRYRRNVACWEIRKQSNHVLLKSARVFWMISHTPKEKKKPNLTCPSATFCTCRNQSTGIKLVGTGYPFVYSLTSLQTSARSHSSNEHTMSNVTVETYCRKSDDNQSQVFKHTGTLSVQYSEVNVSPAAVLRRNDYGLVVMEDIRFLVWFMELNRPQGENHLTISPCDPLSIMICYDVVRLMELMQRTI